MVTSEDLKLIGALRGRNLPGGPPLSYYHLYENGDGTLRLVGSDYENPEAIVVPIWSPDHARVTSDGLVVRLIVFLWGGRLWGGFINIEEIQDRQRKMTKSTEVLTILAYEVSLAF